MDRTIKPLTGDSIVYQNWLLKRSQMTRVFKRRFTILTADGRLFSFRNADLTKPETLMPANASLVWDIRGCVVELFPKMGKHTWVLKPTASSALKEDIYLRICNSSPASSCALWMEIIASVARNNLRPLYEKNATLKLETDLKSMTGNMFYVEIEGTLYSLPAEVPSNIIVPIRSSDPGSCLQIFEFSSGKEEPAAASDPVPRYKFHKSMASLSWPVQRRLPVLLKSQSGSIVSTGSLTLHINEGLQEYIKPLVLPSTVEAEYFDFGLFKFQIRRLLRLIERLGDMYKVWTAVIEWENAKRSQAWLLYLCAVMLIVPQHVGFIFLLHFSINSLSQSFSLNIWWDKSRVRRRLEVVLHHYGIDLGGSYIGDCHQRDPEQSPAPKKQGAAASSSSTAIPVLRTTTPNDLTFNTIIPLPSPSSLLKREIWENQRRTFGGSQFSASNLSVFDRSRWSDDSGKVALDPPSSAEWRIDIGAPCSDDNGWSYNTRWGASADWSDTFNAWAFVRRRRWVPISTQQTTLSGVASSVKSPEGEAQNYHPAPLSALVTSGSEFGHIQSDYDDTNAENQPKLSSFGTMFTEFKMTAAKAQLVIGQICKEVERWVSLFSWRDELVSLMATVCVIIIAVGMLIIPVNFVVFGVILILFHAGYRRSRWRRLAINTVLKQHVSHFLREDADLKRLGGIEAHRLCLIINKRTGVNLTQKVLGEIDTDRDIAGWICNHSAAFVDNRKWLKRDWIDNFVDHIPPDVSTDMQHFFTDADIGQPDLSVNDVVISSENTTGDAFLDTQPIPGAQ
jgi:hypothetical protein